MPTSGIPILLPEKSHKFLSQMRSVMDVRRFDQGAAKTSRDSQGWGNGSTYCSRAPPQNAAKAWCQGQAATTDSHGDILPIKTRGGGAGSETFEESQLC